MARNARPGGGGSVRLAWWRHGRRGQSSPELRATQLWCSVFSVFSSYRTGGVQVTRQGDLLPAGGSEARRAAARFKPQPSGSEAGHAAARFNAPRVGSRQGLPKRV
jgi:hypothetical protein